jgi:hypothetical protein
MDKDSIQKVLLALIKRHFSGSNLKEEEIDALTKLCSMSLASTGKEDPKKLVRQLSDTLVDYLIANRTEIQQNPLTGKIYQIFLIEWYYRHDHLNSDWVWQWNSKGEGALSFNPKKSLDEIELPTK